MAEAPEDVRGSSLIPFHLTSGDGSCLAPSGLLSVCSTANLWTYVKRTKKDGVSFISFLEPSTDKACLSRDSCRGSKSSLSASQCGKCGAKRFELNRDRSSGQYFVAANERKQCLVREMHSDDVRKKRRELQKKNKKDVFNPKSPSLYNKVIMQPCDKGYTPLQVVEQPFHDVGFTLQTADGNCFDGVRFQKCDSASRSGSHVWGIGMKFSGKGEVVRFLYKWYDDTKCLVKHGSDTKLGSCDDNGAKHWGLKGGQLTKDQGKWCVARDLSNMARVIGCNVGSEYIALGLPKNQASAQSSQQQQQLPSRYR